jgi:alkylhydroperoxidase family enzyme
MPDTRSTFPSLADAVAALDSLESAAWAGAARAGWIDLTAQAAVLCAGTLGLAPLRPPAWAKVRAANGRGWLDGAAPGFSDQEVLALAEQFAVDVASVTPDQRRAVTEAAGHRSGDLVATVFVVDFLPRTRGALAALGVPQGGAAAEPGLGDGGVWAAIDVFSRRVARLEALDPVTTELIRLRGARQHACRLCQSLRNRTAVEAGADEALLRSVDAYEDSELGELEKAALGLTDAMIWAPGQPSAAANRLAAVATPEQCAEVVLDVTRNALNKIAVALEADEPHVASGTELYDVDAEGQVVFGLGVGPG